MGILPGGYDIHVLLPHPSLPQVLLLPTEDGWALPHWHTEEWHFWQSVGHVNLDVWDRFGCDVTTLRCLGTASDAGRAVRWYELENHTAAPPAKSGEWLGPEALPDVADAGQRVLLGQWFREAVDGTPPRRRAWARRGWFAAARTWIDDQLRYQGLLRVGPVEQVRSWERGCVLRVPTMKGALYFKALPAVFGHEIPLIELLAASHPDAVVSLLAVDRDRHWMLMADMGDLSLDRVANPARWEEALGRFARLQLATAAAPDALIDLGCPDRRIEALPEHIDSFFAAFPDYPGLSDEDVARLRALAPTLKDACAALARYRIPATLEHGDFWPGNVMISDDAYIYFDWSNSSPSHPFFSLTLFLEFDNIPQALMADPDLPLRLRDAYLAPWAEYGAPDDRIRAFELARKVGPLHLALLYHLTILPNMEARWEMENMVPFYLRMLLR